MHLALALETVGLRKSFGGVLVIDDLSINVSEGEALGIVGPNGAGKTTWFNLITGAVHADAGKVVFYGQDITGASRHDRARMGIGRTFQIPKPFVGMTVFENVLVGATHGRNMKERASYDKVMEVLAITGLEQEGQPLGRFAHPA